MSIGYTASIHIDKTFSLAHNNRTMANKTDNIDVSRSDENEYLKKQSLRKAYNEIFGEALEKYNEGKKKSRQIDNYLTYCKGQHKDVALEAIIAIGEGKENFNLDDDFKPDLDNPKWDVIDTKRKMLDEYVQGFIERNPNFRVFNAVRHSDEMNEHYHLTFVPVATTNGKGLSTQLSKDGAIRENLGFTKAYCKEHKISDYQCFNLWRQREDKAMDDILHKYGFERTYNLEGRKHEELEHFKLRKQNEDLKKEISELKEITKETNKKCNVIEEKYENLKERVKSLTKYVDIDEPFKMKDGMIITKGERERIENSVNALQANNVVLNEELELTLNNSKRFQQDAESYKELYNESLDINHTLEQEKANMQRMLNENILARQGFMLLLEHSQQNDIFDKLNNKECIKKAEQYAKAYKENDYESFMQIESEFKEYVKIDMKKSTENHKYIMENDESYRLKKLQEEQEEALRQKRIKEQQNQVIYNHNRGYGGRSL